MIGESIHPELLVFVRLTLTRVHDNLAINLLSVFITLNMNTLRKCINTKINLAVSLIKHSNYHFLHPTFVHVFMIVVTKSTTCKALHCTCKPCIHHVCACT
jgi:hypothetical protein